jgi:laminin, beta 1
MKGTRCEKCAINYYGNPLERGSSCLPCECNDNTNIRDPASCDQTNGKCRNCLYNTDGDNCEKCKPGFFGNASNHECKRTSVLFSKYFIEKLLNKFF